MTSLLRRTLQRPYALMLVAVNALLLSAPVLAQTGSGGSSPGGSSGSSGGGVDVSVGSTTTTSTEWYSQWWIWAVGIAVFLIIIVALTNRGGTRSNP